MSPKKVSLRDWLINIGEVVLIILLLAGLYLGFQRFWRPKDINTQAFEILVAKLTYDPSVNIRAAAASALGKTGYREAVSPLLVTYETDVQIRREIILALKNLGVTPQELAKKVGAHQPSIQENIKEYVREFNPQEYFFGAIGLSFLFAVIGFFTFSIPFFIKFFSKKARFSISMIVLVVSVSILLWLYYAPDKTEEPQVNPDTGEMAVVELSGVTKDKNMIPKLAIILTDKSRSSEIRTKAAEALGIIGENDALSALMQVTELDKYDEKIRVVASWAIGNILAKEEYKEDRFDYIMFNQGRKEEYDLVLNLDPTNVYAFLGRGEAQIQLGKYELAITDFDKALLYKPNLAPAYFKRGLGYQLNGEMDKAIDDFTKAIDFGYEKGEVYCLRAQAEQSRNSYDKAIDDFKDCILKDTTQAQPHESLGLLYVQINEPELALHEFNAYLDILPEAQDVVQVKEWIQICEENVLP